tara:strand:+ start:110 stop:898 length:789 start_codon:yes stop_codon:yes gene_type:complete
MTQERFDDAVDEIVQEQEQLDNQQNGIETPSLLTEERVRQMMTDQFQNMTSQLQSQMSGLQSGWDRGLNAIRGDMRKELNDKFDELHSQAGRAAFLNNIEDPEQRQNFAYILENQDRIAQSQIPQAQNYTTDAMQPAAPNTAAQAQAQQVFQYLYDRGVPRDHPNINYTILDPAQSPNLTPAQRTQGFYDSVENARRAILQAQQPSQGTTQRLPSDTVNPPVDGGGRSSGSSGSREDADLNLYVTGQINREEFLKRQPNFRR